MMTNCRKNNSQTHIPDFLKLITINANFDRSKSTLTIKVKLDGDIHAYAQGEPHGKPVRLEIAKKNGWEPIGQPVIPAGKLRKSGQGETSVVIEGQFDISQKLKKGHGPGEAIFYFQLCSNTLCDRPRTHLITFE
jgi:hypothetical protein